MGTKLNSRGLAAVMAIVGVAAAAPFLGCGGGDVDISSSGAGGKSGGAGGMGGMAGAGGTGGDPGMCGNGKIEGLEACDDGNLATGDGCEPDCNFTCNNKSPATGDAKCDDQDLCNGAETCQDDHTCAKGKAAPDGTACAMGQICISGVCSPDQCGDAFVSSTEECEDGNVVTGDGCDNCKFTCLSSDAARDCTNLDPCIATACDDATHTCGTPLKPGDICATGSVCKMGACTPTVCGDNVKEGTEVCDDGNLADGDGCDADCTLSCVNAAVDCPMPPACQSVACDPMTNACVTTNLGSDPLCVSPSVCKNGACQAPQCGNGLLEGGEDCDFGAGNGPGTGCELTCKFSCAADADCADTNTCNGTETCGPVMVGGQAGRKCSAGTNVMNCTPCMGGLCQSGACAASMCGDMCLDTAGGEDCEPPGTSTCDAMCKLVPVSVCGNGTREMGEQCDDGNVVNMDGCASDCKFEQIQRVNWLAMQFGTDTYCTANRLGSAIASQGQGTISQALTDAVNDGSISILFHFLGLDDLSGTTDPGLELGPLNAVPVMAPAGMTYNGASDLDWWYTVDMLSLDPNRLPRDRVSGNIAAKVLNAGPGSLTINLVLAGAPAALKMNQARMQATIGNVNKPLASMGTTPGHLAAENLDPNLQSFATMAQPNANAGGKLCGNVTAQSLNQVPVPSALLPGGAAACNQGYSAMNSFLDVLIGGCTITVIIPIQIINIRQPDQQDPNAPDVGAGFPYSLQRDTTTKKVNGCRDKNGTTVNLAQCLADASYSAYFKLATDRVIGK